MKVFRKNLYMKDRNRTEEQCEDLRWPVLCDGAQVSNRCMQGRDGQTYEADASWCEEVTSLDCQSDIDSMKDWHIGTEHVVHMNGQDVRVAVCSVHTSDMLDYKGCNDCALHGPCGGRVPCCAYERTNKDPVYFEHAEAQKSVEQKMKIDKHFAFKKKFFGTTLHEPKVVKTHKTYANDGACEACGAIINKGDFVLTANETDCNKVTKKTHRLCASCTADYIKATSYAMEVIKESNRTYKPITRFETGKWYVCHLKERPSTWNPDGKMDGLLDGKPHKCIMGSKTYASFEHIPLHRDGCWSFCNTIGYFEEVPSPVKSYSERQAEWIKENNVMVGTKVRVTRPFTTYEDGCKIPNTDAKNSFIGDDCEVLIIKNDGLYIKSNAKYDWWYFPYFVLEVVNEPTYEERQAQWVKENNVKEGTKVRFTKGFEEDEDGSLCCRHRDAKGVEGFIDDIKKTWLSVRVPSGGWAVPFTALEVVPEEPWFKIGDKVRITIKSSEVYNKIGTVTNIHIHKDGTQTVYMSFEECWDTKAFNADSEEKIGELYAPTYEERQAEWIKKHNLKEGDKIVILRTAKGGEEGWNNSWTESMSRMVGRVFTYGRDYENGISLSCGYSWPYFVLGVVKE